MNDNKFTEIDAYNATIGDKKIWIANHPYSSFTVSQKTNPFEPITTRPSRRTICMARKKLRHDFYS